jgi:hypothetical protein
VKRSEHVTRSDALKQLIVLPALAGALLSTALPAEAKGSQAQFKYQTKPGPGGHTCSGCRFFQAPHACKIVAGTISPNGWCIAWAKK